MATLSGNTDYEAEGIGVMTDAADYAGSQYTAMGSQPSWWDTYGKGISTVIGAGFSAMSTRREAQVKKDKLNFEAQQYANSAAIAGYQAQLDQQAGVLREQNAQLQTASQFGAQRARMAANGIDLGQGSATDVLASTEYMGERNAMMIRDDTNRQVWQDRVKQSQAQGQQQYDLAKANAINPDLMAAGSFLGSL